MKNHQTNVLISQLKKSKAPLYARLAKELSRPARNARRVNLAQVARHATDRVVVVPGKVLGAGTLDKAVTVAAFGFSEQAEQKIKAAKGSILTIQELMKKYPDAKKVQIVA